MSRNSRNDDDLTRDIVSAGCLITCSSKCIMLLRRWTVMYFGFSYIGWNGALMRSHVAIESCLMMTT
jgi:hypothetical protein